MVRLSNRATRQPTPRCSDRRKVRRRASRFASCRLLTVPVFLASYGISSDRAWPTLCKRPGRLRPTCASSVRSTSAPSDTATMRSKSTVTRTAGDARAVPRARSPRCHGADLLAQEPRSSSLARCLADGAGARQVHHFGPADDRGGAAWICANLSSVSGVKPAILKGQADPVEGCSVLRGQPTAKGRLRRESVSDRYRECEASACSRLEIMSGNAV